MKTREQRQAESAAALARQREREEIAYRDERNLDYAREGFLHALAESVAETSTPNTPLYYASKAYLDALDALGPANKGCG